MKLAGVRENDVGVDLPIDDWLKSAEGKTALKRLKGEKITPSQAQWVVNLIKPVIKDSPGKHSFTCMKIYGKLLLSRSLLLRHAIKRFE